MGYSQRCQLMQDDGVHRKRRAGSGGGGGICLWEDLHLISFSFHHPPPPCDGAGCNEPSADSSFTPLSRREKAPLTPPYAYCK